MDLVEATAQAVKWVEEAMAKSRALPRRCEICDGAMGDMTVAAYLAAHRHCALCAPECEECQEEARA